MRTLFLNNFSCFKRKATASEEQTQNNNMTTTEGFWKGILVTLNISVWLERLWDVCNSLLLYAWSESPNSPLCLLELCNCFNPSISGLQDCCLLFSSFTSRSSSSSGPWLAFQKVQQGTLTTTYSLVRMQQQRVLHSIKLTQSTGSKPFTASLSSPHCTHHHPGNRSRLLFITLKENTATKISCPHLEVLSDVSQQISPLQLHYRQLPPFPTILMPLSSSYYCVALNHTVRNPPYTMDTK